MGLVFGTEDEMCKETQKEQILEGGLTGETECLL